MSYKNLKNFNGILNKSEFGYISDLSNIKLVSDAILYHLPVPDGNESYYLYLLNEFLKNLASFYTWVGGSAVPKLENGFSLCHQQLTSAINLFKEDPARRKAIPGKHLRKMNKAFLKGLSMVYRGIRDGFEIYGPQVNLNKEQIIRWILDETEGFGRKYQFNRTGKYSFINRLPQLDKDELAVVIRLLRNPEGHIRTTETGWRDLGMGKQKVRILFMPKVLGRKRVYFLFKVTEHDDYDRHADLKPQKVAFTA